MAQQHPDSPKQFGIRLSEATMELVSAIQEFRQQTNQPTTLASIVEDAIEVYYEDLVEEGAIVPLPRTDDTTSPWCPRASAEDPPA
jgi:hypothetical protein